MVTSKKAIIVGASSGIGKALALQLADSGYKTAITGRRAGQLDTIKQSYPDNIITSSYDCTEADNGAELDAITKRLGGLDLLIISAGMGDLNESLEPCDRKPHEPPEHSGLHRNSRLGLSILSYTRSWTACGLSPLLPGFGVIK